jgi:hypothetical protein
VCGPTGFFAEPSAVGGVFVTGGEALPAAVEDKLSAHNSLGNSQGLSLMAPCVQIETPTIHAEQVRKSGMQGALSQA